jgi:hypothetical protein
MGEPCKKPTRCETPPVECDCPPEKNSFPYVSQLIRWTGAKCYSYQQLLANIFGALLEISASIKALVEGKIPAVSGILSHRAESYGEIASGDSENVQLFTSTFEYDVVGIGASYIPPALTNEGTIYDASHKVIVRFFDFTAGSQVGNDLVLSIISVQANFHNFGNAIGGFGLGHLIGVQIEFDGDIGATMQDFPIDLFMVVKPKALNTNS